MIDVNGLWSVRISPPLLNEVTPKGAFLSKVLPLTCAVSYVKEALKKQYSARDGTKQVYNKRGLYRIIACIHL